MRRSSQARHRTCTPPGTGAIWSHLAGLVGKRRLARASAALAAAVLTISTAAAQPKYGADHDPGAAVAALVSRTIAPTIWMGGSDGPDHSYPALLNEYGPTVVASGVSVLNIYTTDLTLGNPSEMQRIITYCRASGLKLDAGGYLVSAFSPSEVSEGEAPPGQIDRLVRHLHSLRGELDYFRSDETLLRAHTFYKHSITEIAANAAGNARLLRAAFPNIQVADIEPFPQNMAELRSFLQLFARDAGHPFDIYNPDIAWNSEYGDTGWLRKLPELSKLVHKLHIRLAIIYNGNDKQSTNAIEWVTLAEQRIAAVESDPAINVDDAIIETWAKYPTKLGPPTEPGTMLNLTTVYASLVRLYRSDYLTRPATTHATIAAPASIRPDSSDHASLSSIKILGPQQEIDARSRLAAVLILDTGKFEGDAPAAVPSGVRTEKVKVLAGTINDINDALARLHVSGAMPRTVLDIEVFGVTGNLGRKRVTIARQ